MIFEELKKKNNIVRGYDMSHWNTQEQFDEYLSNSGFIIHKATQGLVYIDKTFDARMPLLMLAGKRIGLYHYLTKEDGMLQALHFYSTIWPYVDRIIQHHGKPGIIPNLIFIVDYEEKGTVKELHKFLIKFHQLSGIWCVVYTSASWLNKVEHEFLLDEDSPSRLWVAGWTKSAKRVQDRIDAIPNMVLYQYATEPLDTNIWLVDRFNWESRKE